jgi:hypothetical protein
MTLYKNGIENEERKHQFLNTLALFSRLFFFFDILVALLSLSPLFLFLILKNECK